MKKEDQLNRAAGDGGQKLLYQSTGANRTVAVVLGVLSVLLLALAVVTFRTTRYVRAGETTPVIAMGIIVLACGSGLLAYAILFGRMLRRCWLKIYEDHIEYYGGGMNNYGSLPITQVQSVQMFRMGVMIYGGAKLKMYCKEPQKVFQILNQWQANHHM